MPRRKNAAGARFYREPDEFCCMPRVHPQAKP